MSVTSPAFRAGAPVSGITRDQRGLPRSATTPTLGAFEPQVTAPTLSVTNTGGTYNGSPFPATGTAVGVDGKTAVTGSFGYAYYVGSSATGTPSATAPRNAGTYTVVATFTSGDANYGNGSARTTFTIGKANATVVVTPYDVTYDGKPHAATVTSITGVNGETGAAVGTVRLRTTHTNAGTYSGDSWSFTGTANYNNIASTAITNVIRKAPSAVVVTVSGGPFTYTGLPQRPATVAVTGAGGLSLAPAATYANNVNAGTATARYTYAGDANHTGSSGSQTFTIGKANVAVVVSPYTVTYDGKAHAATVTSIAGVNGETGAAVGTVTLSTTHSDVGTYSDSWSFTGTANYNDIASTTITNTISGLQRNGKLLKIVGAPGQELPVKVTLLRRESALGSEIGFFVLDANGKINGRAPGQRGFLRTALRSSGRRIVFRSGRRAGLVNVLKQFAGQQLLFYIIPNRGPHVFTGRKDANPDRVNHLRITPLGGFGFHLAWEDQFGGGDRDFNDVIVKVSLGP